MKALRLFYFFAIVVIVFSCQKDKDHDFDPKQEGEIEFYISFSNLKSERNSNLLKSAHVLDDANKIVFTIQKSTGDSTKYNSTEIDLFKMGNDFFSQKLSLRLGDYRLTEFFLLDAGGNTIYVAPTIGSQQAQNVNNPLPIDFTISKDQITSVSVEVLSTEGLTPNDFGLVGFPFVEIETFGFLINVSEQGQMDSLITSNITVTSGAYTYSQPLDAIATNIVYIKDGFENYTVEITKPNYDSFIYVFLKDSLLKHQTEPLTIELYNPSADQIVDGDGNVYESVTIGNQTWLTTNLKTTRFCNGDVIEDGTVLGDISGEESPKYWFAYNDNLSNVDVYGRLYTGYVVQDDRNVCPCGWHVPTKEDWDELISFIGGATGGGSKLNQVGTTLWQKPNLNSTNEYGFTALPSGVRRYSGSFQNLGVGVHFWEQAVNPGVNGGQFRRVWGNDDISDIQHANTYSIKSGMAIRCIKD